MGDLNESEFAESTIQHIIQPPSDLRASSISETEVKLEWEDNCLFEDGYKIDRKAGSDQFANIASIGSDMESFID